MTHTGMQLKEQGQQLALFGSPGWAKAALEKLRIFCKARKAARRPEFRIEEFRDESIKSGWPLPNSPNAWGALPREALKQRLIVKTGKYEKADSDATRSHPVAIWRAL